MPIRSEDEELVTVVKKQLIKHDATSDAEATSQNVWRRSRSLAAHPKSNEHSDRIPEHDRDSKRTWTLGGYIKQRSARKRHDNATEQHHDRVAHADSGSVSNSANAAKSRTSASLPSSSTKIDSAFTTQKAKSRRRQLACAGPSTSPTPLTSNLVEPGGDEVTTATADGLHITEPPHNVFQQPGMNRRQSNAFVFDLTPQMMRRSQPPPDTNALMEPTSTHGSKISASAKGQSPSINLPELSQVETQMSAQLPPQTHVNTQTRHSLYSFEPGQLSRASQTNSHLPHAAEMEVQMDSHLHFVGSGTAGLGQDLDEPDLLGA